MTEDAALLSCCGLRKTYGKDAGLVRAVDGVDLDGLTRGGCSYLTNKLWSNPVETSRIPLLWRL
jgi:hypothetical protein